MRLFHHPQRGVPKNLMAKTRSLTLCSRHAPPKQSAQTSAGRAASCCVRAYLGWAFQPGGHDQPMDRRADPHMGCRSLYSVPDHPGFVLGGFTSNGYGDLSPGHYNLLSCAFIETVLTFFFLIVILGATSAGAPASFAVGATGLALTIIHLISIRSATPRSIPRAAPVRRSSPAKPISNSFGSSCWRRSRAPLWPLSSAGLCSKPG